MRKGKLFLVFLLVSVFHLINSGCANQVLQKQKMLEKQQQKLEKKLIKDYQLARKRHFKMQTPETQSRMKASQKRLKKYQKARRNK
ncbi:MAG TPA: hypothetical protein PLI65_08075 [Bacteroidales bacterium]|nr:hypothetical protein [Bacteroidales bacterium]